MSAGGPPSLTAALPAVITEPGAGKPHRARKVVAEAGCQLPTLYMFSTLGSAYCDDQHLHEVRQPHEIAIMLTACRRPFTLKVGTDVRSVQAALVTHRVQRSIEARGTQHITFRVAPLHRLFTKLIGAPIQELDRSLFDALQPEIELLARGELTHQQGMRLFLDAVQRLADTLPPVAPIDPRVPEILRLLRENPAQSLECLAHAVDLSPSRLSHLFSTSFGMPLRSFLIWRRIGRTVWYLVNERDMSMTEIAYQLGFSDSSHFARTFFQFTGYTPSQLRGGTMRIVIP